MEQKFGNLVRVMETETISKNGVCSTNRMSKRNKIKRVFFLICSFSICLAQSWGQTNDFEIDSKGVLVKYHGAGGSVVIPNTVTEIGNRVFLENFSLTSITIPNSVTSIGDSAFFLCLNLTSVTIPNSVTFIGEDAFWGCKINFLTIPNSVTYIGEGAFGFSNNMLIKLDAGNTAYLLEGDVLYNKSKTLLHTYPAGKSGKSFSIPASITKIGNSAFSGCTRLITVMIPNSVISIGDCAFYFSGLTSLTIPNSVTSIGAVAFGSCENLSSVTIPNSVSEIGQGAFSYCTNLRIVTVEWTIPYNVPENEFKNVNTSEAILRVPTGTKALYQAADVWKDFGMIVEYDFVGNEHIKLPALKAYASNTMLYISGLQYNNPLSIYSINGQLVYQGIAKSETEQISLNAPGVYIIEAENQSIKVMVK